MSLQYILDGYNIVHKVSGLSSGSLEEQRSKLIRYIEVQCPQGSLKNQVTIVFDGRSDVYSDGIQSSVKVLFSRDESADEKIKRLVVNADHKATLIVVSDDRDIQFSIRAQGAKAMSVDEFFSKKTKTQSTINKAGKSIKNKDQKNISSSTEFKITQEFEKIWIRSKKKD